MDYEAPPFFHVMRYAAEAEGDVIDMVSGNPDWDPPKPLKEYFREFADADSELYQYPASDGLLELREEIAARRNVDVEQVVVTNGTGEANYLAMARAFERDAGHEVALADPVYPYYEGRTEMLGGEVRLVPTDHSGALSPEAMTEAVSDDTACIVLNTPNNPTGAVYDFEVARTCVDLAEDHDALLVADEVYDRFDFTGRFESALTLESPNRIVTSGFSKSMAITGLRVGYGIFPREHADAARSRHMLVTLAGNRPAQTAVLRALRETGPEYYEAARETLRERAEAFTAALEAAGAEYTQMQGAFYVMARFEDYPGTMENVKRLIDEVGVAGMPGEAFGASREEWIRFAIVTPRATEAAERLAEYF